jgi:hypothetical protein
MEFLIRNFDSHNTDPDLDRTGCRKRGMCDQTCEDDAIAWEGFSGLNLGVKFVVLKVPGLTAEEVSAYEGMRKVWRDNFDYTILATRPAQGEFDIKIFEVNKGASDQNLMTGAKLIRARDYLLQWGCSDFEELADGGSFTFSLWNAVRSVNFWGVTVTILAQLSFTLNSYSGATGIGNITVTVPESMIQQAERKIAERGGTVTETVGTAITFTIDRSNVLTKFRADVKQRIEQTFMYQQHRINTATMDAAVAADGMLTLTKAELLAAIVDAAAE